MGKVSREQRTVSSALSAMSFSDQDWQSVDPRQTLILAEGKRERWGTGSGRSKAQKVSNGPPTKEHSLWPSHL